MADTMFDFSAIKMLELHVSSEGKTFHYVFSKSNDEPLFGPPPPWYQGVGHGEDLLTRI
jgi:hypothetical protein